MVEHFGYEIFQSTVIVVGQNGLGVSCNYICCNSNNELWIHSKNKYYNENIGFKKKDCEQK